MEFIFKTVESRGIFQYYKFERVDGKINRQIEWRSILLRLVTNK